MCIRDSTKSDSGIYGTASWMDEKEMHEVLEVSPIGQAEGTILGEYKVGFAKRIVASRCLSQFLCKLPHFLIY